MNKLAASHKRPRRDYFLFRRFLAPDGAAHANFPGSALILGHRLKQQLSFDGSECRTGHERAARGGAGGVHAAEAGQDVGGGRLGGRVRVRGRQTPGKSPARGPRRSDPSAEAAGFTCGGERLTCADR